jgi:hypothetical protein
VNPPSRTRSWDLTRNLPLLLRRSGRLEQQGLRLVPHHEHQQLPSISSACHSHPDLFGPEIRATVEGGEFKDRVVTQ